MDKMSANVAYARPMKAPHPEVADLDATKAGPATVSSLAGNLNGQLTETLDRAQRILDRIQGAEPTKDACGKPVAHCLDVLMHENCDMAGNLIVILDRIESRIGG